MVSRKGKAIIGAFVLGAIALIGIAVILLGSGSYNYQKTSFVLYFNSTLRGLTVGSSVYYNGVRVGKVTSLEITPASDRTSFNTPVIIELEKPQKIVGRDDAIGVDLVDYLRDPKNVDQLIESGLRAKLSTLSFITGLLVVDLAMVPDAKPVNLTELKPYYDIPQLPTISSGLDSVISEFSNLPFEHIAASLLEVLSKVNKILETVDADELLTNVNSAIVAVNQAAGEYTSLAKIVNNNLDGVFEKLDGSFTEINKTMQSVDAIFV